MKRAEVDRSVGAPVFSAAGEAWVCPLVPIARGQLDANMFLHVTAPGATTWFAKVRSLRRLRETLSPTGRRSEQSRVTLWEMKLCVEARL